jgi:hypothetical protein
MATLQQLRSPRPFSAEHAIKASVFSLNYLDGRTDNCVVGPSKQTRRLGFWLWVFVVALAALIWPWQPTVRLISPAGTPASTPSSHSVK